MRTECLLPLRPAQRSWLRIIPERTRHLYQATAKHLFQATTRHLFQATTLHLFQATAWHLAPATHGRAEGPRFHSPGRSPGSAVARTCGLKARVIAVFLATAAATTLHAQETQTLHVTAKLVEVSAVVTDKDGVPKTGLTKDDFILKQDGKEQPIRYFSQGDELPLTFLIMIDTSTSQRTFIDDEQRACDVFFQTIMGRPQDHAALVEVNAKIAGRSELTNDPNKLHLALTGLRYDAAAGGATRLNDAIYTLSKGVLATVRGRKAIILISDGGDNGSATRQEDAIAEAQRDNVPIYAVSYSAWSGLDPMPTGGGTRPTRDPGMANLKQWAGATGGHVYEVSRGTTLRHIFESIAAELRSQYEIGYTLPPDTSAKQFHKLELKAKDKSLRVQARTGFLVAP